MEISRPTRGSVTLDSPPLNPKPWGTWWRAWTFTSSTLITCWARTASPCTLPCSTRTCTWSARTRRASPTSGSRSSLTPRATLAPANRRRPGCGIVAMASGSTFTSTAQEHLLHHFSDQWSWASSLLECVFWGAVFFSERVYEAPPLRGLASARSPAGRDRIPLHDTNQSCPSFDLLGAGWTQDHRPPMGWCMHLAPEWRARLCPLSLPWQPSFFCPCEMRRPGGGEDLQLNLWQFMSMSYEYTV